MIALKNLEIGYRHPLLNQPLNITFKDNRIYGILGRSGCGKSTLLKTICGLHRPISGCVRKKDDSVIYMMHQKYTNFDWLTCTENILIAERSKKSRIERREEALRILDRVGLGDYAERYPRELSGGMQQRLALARMLFVKPKYLLMDEPLSALDDATRKEMQRLIIENHKETQNTIIMVTHSEAEANKMCDYVIRIEGKDD